MGIRTSGMPTPAFRKVMIFIDGGYLRKGFQTILGHDKINFVALADCLTKLVQRGRIKANL
jgi:hypothetical protein